ncbi:MAG: alpha-glucosidase C-terminal domain-containing protein, partial [Paludibacteraceae bacterium]|nr:alpha-glucosidase C-terminal domain-containing protein [Paludibacteraceae bacterium]
FDMYYGWTLHSLMNNVAQQQSTVEDLWNYFARADKDFPDYAIRMNFTSNHDENSWHGTEFERMGDASDAMAVFTYVIPGMPLIYTGQEYANNHRLEFFEKDVIDRNEDAHQFSMYQRLNQLRKENKALWSEELGAPMLRIQADNDKVFALARPLEDNTVLAVFNFSPEEQTVTLQTAKYQGNYSCLCGHQVEIGEQTTLTLKPWAFKIWTK